MQPPSAQCPIQRALLPSMLTGFSSQRLSGSSRMGIIAGSLNPCSILLCGLPGSWWLTDPLSLKLQLEPSWRLAAITYVGRRDVGGPEVSGAAFSASTSCLVSFSVCLSQENKNIPFLCAMFIQGWKPQRVTEGKMTILLVYALVSPDTWCCEYGLGTCPVESCIIDGLHKGDDRKWLIWIQGSWLFWNMHYWEQGEEWSLLSVILTFILVFKSQGLWQQAF